jgi:hypothetical protein
VGDEEEGSPAMEEMAGEKHHQGRRRGRMPRHRASTHEEDGCTTGGEVVVVTLGVGAGAYTYIESRGLGETVVHDTWGVA